MTHPAGPASEDEDRPQSDFDPYDPARPLRRPTAAPRLVDRSERRPVDPGPVVARPHQAQVRQSPETVTPPEDNPLTGWRWTGVSLLSRTLWPREARTNPFMVYFSGRRRGRLAEDLIGLLPWAALLLAEVAFFITLGKSAEAIIALEFSLSFALPVLVMLYTAVMTAMHVRRTARNLRLDEVLLTRLTPIDIVQGITIRPLAVQSAAAFYYSAMHLLLAVMTVMSWSDAGENASFLAGGVCVLTLLRWSLAGIALESGGAYAVRAHLCIENAFLATLRMLLDMFLLPGLVVGVGGGLILLAILLTRSFAGFGMGAGIVLGLLLMTVGGLVLVFLVITLILWLRTLGSNVMDFCYHYPHEWWFHEEASELPERTLFMPWNPRQPEKAEVNALERARLRRRQRTLQAQMPSPAPRPYLPEGEEPPYQPPQRK